MKFKYLLNHFYGNRLTVNGMAIPRCRVAVHRGEEEILF